MRFIFLALLSFTLCVNVHAGELDDQRAEVEKKVIGFVKKTARSDIKFQSIGIKKSTPIGDGWYGVVVTLKISGVDEVVEDTFLTNGKFVTQNLINIDTLDNYAQLTVESGFEKLPESYYSEENLIFGSLAGKHKVVIFSDPLCPFCMELMSKLELFLKGKKDIAVFYYPFALERLHPTSKAIVKAVELLKHNGFENVDWKLYGALFTNVRLLDLAKAGDVDKLISEIYKVDIHEIKTNHSKVEEHLKKNSSMIKTLGVKGTPTMYVDGVIDLSGSKLFGLGD